MQASKEAINHGKKYLKYKLKRCTIPRLPTTKQPFIGISRKGCSLSAEAAAMMDQNPPILSNSLRLSGCPGFAILMEFLTCE